MPLFPLDPPDLSLDAVGALAQELLPNEEVETCGLASDEKSNNIMYKVRTKQGGTYGLKFFRRDTVAIEETARARVTSFVNSAPLMTHGQRSAVGPYPYAMFRWIPGEIIFNVVGQLDSEAEVDSLAEQLAAILAGFARTDIVEFPMPDRFDLGNLVPFLRQHYGPYLPQEDLDHMVHFCLAQRAELESDFRGKLSLVHGALQENVVSQRGEGKLRVTGVIDWEHAWQGEPVLDYLYLMEGLGSFPMKAEFQARLHHHCGEVGLHFPRATHRCFMLISCFGLADKIMRAGFMSHYVRLHTALLLDEMSESA